MAIVEGHYTLIKCTVFLGIREEKKIEDLYQLKTGGNVTLQCFYQSDVATGNGENHLAITDLSISDSGTYYCASSYLYMFDFAEGTVVSVQGSGLNIPAQVHQSASESIQPGGSVTLDCTVHTGTCDGEHRVYWFKHSGQAHPGLIYTHGGSNDQCERKPETQTHSCVYNLRMNSLNVSDAGTYYCAVASCGHMLFGNGTRLDFEVLINSDACSCIKQNIKRCYRGMCVLRSKVIELDMFHPRLFSSYLSKTCFMKSSPLSKQCMKFNYCLTTISVPLDRAKSPRLKRNNF
uniref:Ig-like domain-containing protein n=1 Tax=Mastacembelus armatus TaxID=205130 RepID=A0A7N9B0I0_9TELE